MALIGGLEAPAGRVMGHAGAWTAPGLQKRGYHATRRTTPASIVGYQQKRSLYLKQAQALEILKQKSVPVAEEDSGSNGLICISIDRSALSPCIVASSDPESDPRHLRRIPFSYGQATVENHPMVAELADQLNIPSSSRDQLGSIVQALWEIFKEKEAFVLECQIGVSADGTVAAHGARFGFDDAAYRSSGRQEEIHRLRNTSEEVPEEVEAEKYGIVYVKYVVASTFLGKPAGC
ncbi:Succinate--CoA ligase subunit alpha [Penicillium diatomitis]|uniref:Succinate--CoA ligase subunit alpha n=1 Tax=Penicillium diatomitis TaxID=2819901 RepID=A0A9W9XF99_9EURO|nr:Succinate--CoA ligase subunit alpha [Penicillium diatomitis]KAJ5491175.1 Succinate--CoA ligase subunit alpha [Penicillium diatomitis]